MVSKIQSNRLNMFDSENIMRVIYGLLLLVLILGWNLSDIRSRLSKSIQYVFVWIFIFGAIIIFVTMTDTSSSSTIVNSAKNKPSTRMLLAVGDEEPKNPFLRVIKTLPQKVKVIDADTIDVDSERVRLNGISADERGAPTYTKCKQKVAFIVDSSSSVVCYMSGVMTYNREVGECFLNQNGVKRDLNRLIVESGCARDCKRYSRGIYKKYETPESKKLYLPNYCK